ncbi:MAG: single-stranded DNA-binding protein [Treponema sp.]|jgi:single-strand DNA-binding protein|nr:single-stranded DNA-binding protein [Treponema sp.]
MVDINHVVLVGRLTRDAELKYTASGQAVCKFSIAVNRHRKQGEQWVDDVNFFDIVVWGRQGESLNQYLVKGKLVGIDGELRQDRWEQDGQNRSKIEVVANNLQLLGSNAGQPGGTNVSYPRTENNYSDRPPASHAPSYQSGGSQPPEHSGLQDSFADDIPF